MSNAKDCRIRIGFATRKSVIFHEEPLRLCIK